MIHSPKNILITGGCGFIGSNFINYMFEKWSEANFINVDKLILNSDARYVNDDVINSNRYKLVTADIKNRDIMTSVLNENEIETIIHFAADCTSTRCYDHPIESLKNNTISFIELLEVVKNYKNIKKFIHISTDEVYGDSDLSKNEVGKVEIDVLRPGNVYAATKVACESFVHFYTFRHHLPIIIVRINNIFGPNQWSVKVVPRYIDVAIKKGKFPVQGTGTQLRSWLYVDDASEGIGAVTEKGRIGEIYNIGTYFEMNVLDLAKTIQSEVDKQLARKSNLVEFASIPDRPYNDLRYLLNFSKISNELGWFPKIPFDEGIRRVVASTLSPQKKSERMIVIIYGGGGYIGKYMQNLLTSNRITYHTAKCKIGVDTIDSVIRELKCLHGTHVLSCIGRTHGGVYKTIEYLEGGPDKVYKNIRDNLYSVIVLAELCDKLGLHFTYIGTAYLYSYDGDHLIGGKKFMENDRPSFIGNSYSIVKGFTDLMLRQYHGSAKECLNARITLPLNFNLTDERNLLTKILGYRQILDIPVSITILDDCMPLLLTLMEKRIGGNLNLVNPEPISLHEILQIYRKIVNPDIQDYECIEPPSEGGRHLMAIKGNCALDTSRLEELCPTLLNSKESLELGFAKLRVNMYS